MKTNASPCLTLALPFPCLIPFLAPVVAGCPPSDAKLSMSTQMSSGLGYALMSTTPWGCSRLPLGHLRLRNYRMHYTQMQTAFNELSPFHKPFILHIGFFLSTRIAVVDECSAVSCTFPSYSDLRRVQANMTGVEAVSSQAFLCSRFSRRIHGMGIVSVGPRQGIRTPT
ncbi:hypothetical protein BC826DRAFT_992398 [Russula brevipes]|nr:hypothetical protein BC826DRAFT_992398 [Russula brevipes]